MRRRSAERVWKLRGACRPAAKPAIQEILEALGLATCRLRDPLFFLLQSLGSAFRFFLGTPLAPSLPRSGLLQTSRFCGWFSALLGGSDVLRTATLMACASLGELVAQSGAHARLPSVLTLVLPLLLGALPAPDFAHLLLCRSLPGSSRFH